METFNGIENWGTGLIVGAILFLLVWLIVFYILFYLSIYKTFNQIAYSNREIQPGLVWLLFVPCVGPIWLFFVVHYLNKSLHKEYLSRGLVNNSIHKAYTIGMIMAALGIVNYSFNGNSSVGLGIEAMGSIVSLGWLALRIFYWVKIHSFWKELSSKYTLDDTLDSGTLIE